MCPADCGPAGQYIGSKPPPKKTHWPCKGRRPRINKPLHQCGLPICRPAGALTTLARRCFATNMSPRWGFEDAGAAMFGYRYVAPLGLWRRWRGDVLLPICRPAGALTALARRWFATDMSPRWGLRDHLANGGIHKRLRRSRGRQSKCRSYPRCYGRCNRPLYP